MNEINVTTPQFVIYFWKAYKQFSYVIKLVWYLNVHLYTSMTYLSNPWGV